MKALTLRKNEYYSGNYNTTNESQNIKKYGIETEGPTDKKFKKRNKNRNNKTKDSKDSNP